MTYKRTELNPVRTTDEKKLEKMLLEKRELMNRLRNSIINSSRNSHRGHDEIDEIEFLLKRF